MKQTCDCFVFQIINAAVIFLLAQDYPENKALMLAGFVLPPR